MQQTLNGALTVRQLSFSDISGTVTPGQVPSAALTSVNDTNVTIALGGSPTTALLAATSITLGWAGQLGVTRGGTGLSTVAQGDLLYGSATNTIASLAKNTTATRYLANTGTSNAPQWDQVNLANGVTGTIQATNFPALTGDLSTPGGSLATTLATVNSNVGSFGSASLIPTFTVNAKGLVTAAGTVSPQLGTSSVFGVVKVDGTTITSSAGVITAVAGAAASIQPGTTAVTGGTVGNILAVGSGPTLVQFAPSQINSVLGVDIAMNVANTYFDGPSVAQGSTGTWFVCGTLTVIDTAASRNFDAKLWDGTTVISSCTVSTAGANFSDTITLCGFITSPAGNLRISCRTNSTTAKIQFNQSGNIKDSTITAYRLI
ncbi:hypothetical protein [Bradyrhizobium sp. USDA 4452]